MGKTEIKWDKYADEAYCLWGTCGKCGYTEVAESASYCGGCGRKIVNKYSHENKNKYPIR